MPGERADVPERRLPLRRRNFLQLGLVGVTFDPDRIGWGVAPAPVDPTARTSLEEGEAAPTPASTGLDASLPLVAKLVSVGGLAPPADTPVGAAVRLSDGRFSLAKLAAEYELTREPTSVRELTTPQTSGPPATAEQKAWENWLEDYRREDAEDLTISGSDEAQRTRLIQLVVQKAEEKFRAVGSGHSHSEAARPEKFYSDLKEVEGPLPQPWLRAADDTFWDGSGVDRDSLVRLQAGTVLKKLNREILRDANLGLPNMGSWDGQTLAGAINTSTHGTGLGLGTFADLVRSVEIVTVPESQYEPGAPHVRLLRIEPTDGITDPEAFPRDAGVHNTTLVQDDDLFHAVVVGYGCLGFVYAYTLELQASYWLREQNWIERWGSFDPVGLAESNRHFNVLVDLISPQLTGSSTPDCLLRTRNPTASGGRTPTERSNAATEFETNVNSLLTSWQSFDAQELAEAVAEIGDNFERLLTFDLLNIAGYDPPFEGGRHESVYYIALRRKREVDPDPDVPPAPPIDALTTEIAVPVDRVEAAVERVIQLVKDSPRFFPAPLGVRFTDGSEHAFSPEYRRPTAMLEFIVPQPQKLQDEIDAVETGRIYAGSRKIFYQKLKKINEETGLLAHLLELSVAKDECQKVERILVDEFEGRPHLGKFNTVHVESSRANMRPGTMFPAYEQWADAEAYLNRFGTFDGDFTDNKGRP